MVHFKKILIKHTKNNNIFVEIKRKKILVEIFLKN